MGATSASLSISTMSAAPSASWIPSATGSGCPGRSISGECDADAVSLA